MSLFKIKLLNLTNFIEILIKIFLCLMYLNELRFKSNNLCTYIKTNIIWLYNVNAISCFRNGNFNLKNFKANFINFFLLKQNWIENAKRVKRLRVLKALNLNLCIDLSLCTFTYRVRVQVHRKEFGYIVVYWQHFFGIHFKIFTKVY